MFRAVDEINIHRVNTHFHNFLDKMENLNPQPIWFEDLNNAFWPQDAMAESSSEVYYARIRLLYEVIINYQDEMSLEVQIYVKYVRDMNRCFICRFHGERVFLNENKWPI